MAMPLNVHSRTTLKVSICLVGIMATGLLAWPMASSAQSGFLSTKPTARQEYWQVREAEIARQLSQGKELSRYKLVFIGDSITDFWQMHEDLWVKGKWHGGEVWDETFGGSDPVYRSLNLGISGDRTEHMLYRLLPKSAGGQGELDAPELAPDYLVIMAGINNSWAPEPKTAEAIFAGVEEVVKLAHHQKPKARIILQSILPTLDPIKNRDIVQPVNDRLSMLAQSPELSASIVYLNLYPAFLDAEGKQRPELFVDGLHPSKEGYQIWRDQLVPAIASDRAKSVQPHKH